MRDERSASAGAVPQWKWLAGRQRGLFRKSTQVGYLDPRDGTWTVLPELDISAGYNAIAYVSRWDVYLVVGQSGHDTRVFDPETNEWRSIDGGEASFGEPGDHMWVSYDAAHDQVGLTHSNGRFYTFQLVPGECL